MSMSIRLVRITLCTYTVTGLLSIPFPYLCLNIYGLLEHWWPVLPEWANEKAACHPSRGDWPVTTSVHHKYSDTQYLT